jgi:hypothetical protein
MELSELTAMLARTPSVAAVLLADLPDNWLHRSDGPGTWSAYDIVGHLVEGDATNWVPRARMIMEYGSQRTFEAFDREAMLGRQPEPIGTLLARFADARVESLRELGSLGIADGDLDRRGHHGDFGEVTLGQLLATWLAHDLTHLAQVGEVLAGRYRDEVGPWRAFMPALDRTAAAE